MHKSCQTSEARFRSGCLFNNDRTMMAMTPVEKICDSDSTNDAGMLNISSIKMTHRNMFSTATISLFDSQT